MLPALILLSLILLIFAKLFSDIQMFLTFDILYYYCHIVNVKYFRYSIFFLHFFTSYYLQYLLLFIDISVHFFVLDLILDCKYYHEEEVLKWTRRIYIVTNEILLPSRIASQFIIIQFHLQSYIRNV